MNITKPTVQGVDEAIQGMQTFLYNQLKNIWGLSDDDYKAYGRAYKNQDESGSYMPEVFVGVGNDPNQTDYQDTFFDDTVKAVSFFGMGESEKYSVGSSTVPVFMIFMVQIPTLKTGFTSRADEEVRQDVKRLWMAHRFGFTMTGTETGIANVFREYPSWAKKVKFRDEHPWHCFRINSNLLYNLLNC